MQPNPPRPPFPKNLGLLCELGELFWNWSPHKSSVWLLCSWRLINIPKIGNWHEKRVTSCRSLNCRLIFIAIPFNL